jgi:hypothetical protein
MGSPEVGIVMVRPEGRDLVLVTAAPDRDGSEPVLICSVLEERGGLLRKGRGREVPVDRRATEQRIPQRATDDIGGVTVVPQDPQELPDRARDRAGQVAAVAQFRPRKRYVRQASLRSSARYGVNIE